MSYEDFVVLVVDDESTKWFIPIHQNSQRSYNIITKYELSKNRVIQWIQNATLSTTVERSNTSLWKLLMMNPQNVLCLSIKMAKDQATELQKYELSNQRIIQWTRNVSVSATVGRSSVSLRIHSVFDSSIITHYSSTCFEFWIWTLHSLVCHSYMPLFGEKD